MSRGSCRSLLETEQRQDREVRLPGTVSRLHQPSPSRSWLQLGIHFEAKIVNCSLCFGESLVLLDGSNHTFMLDSFAGERSATPPVDPDVLGHWAPPEKQTDENSVSSKAVMRKGSAKSLRHSRFRFEMISSNGLILTAWVVVPHSAPQRPWQR